jgi:peptidoglycan/xylan/chitin deacetylase (PgdA/CDA1 family)
MTSNITLELQQLREAAQRNGARYVHLKNFAYPEDKRIAVNFTLDFDTMLRRRFSNEPIMQLAKGEFGGRVGIWRLLELFESHEMKATIFTPGRICELYPQALAAAAAAGHEIADHMWEHQVPADADLEYDHLVKSTEALERFTGRRPVGTRSSHTAAFLKQLGYIYKSDGVADHLPYYVADAQGKNYLLNLPFHYAIDDAMFFNFGWVESGLAGQRLADPESVLEIWWNAFEHLYEQGSYLNICLHPFISGRSMRTAMLDRFITNIKTKPGVWLTTCEDLARYCIAHYPPPSDAA